MSTGLLVAKDAQVDSLQQRNPCVVLTADAPAKTQVLCQDLGYILGA